MKFNGFLAAIATLMSVLFAYIIYLVVGDEGGNQWLYAIGSFVCFASTLVPLMATKHAQSRKSINIKVFSTIFFVAFFIIDFILALFDAGTSTFIILNGLILLVNLGGQYKLSQANL